jgi:hypothetical protein
MKIFKQEFIKENYHNYFLPIYNSMIFHYLNVYLNLFDS